MCKGSFRKRERAFLLCVRRQESSIPANILKRQVLHGKILPHLAFSVRQDAQQCAWRSNRALTGAVEALLRKGNAREFHLGLHFTSTRPRTALTASEDTGASPGATVVSPTLWDTRKQAHLLASFQNRVCRALKEENGDAGGLSPTLTTNPPWTAQEFCPLYHARALIKCPALRVMV